MTQTLNYHRIPKGDGDNSQNQRSLLAVIHCYLPAAVAKKLAFLEGERRRPAVFELDYQPYQPRILFRPKLSEEQAAIDVDGLSGEVAAFRADQKTSPCGLPFGSYADSAKVTDNLWGERWSKLVANEAIRHFQARLGSEAIRIGEARGYKLEEIDHLPPETIARAGQGEAAAELNSRRLRFSSPGRSGR